MKVGILTALRAITLTALAVVALHTRSDAQISPYPPCNGVMTLYFSTLYNCNTGGANVTVIPNCALPPFSYTWSNGQISTATLLNVPPGTYSVTVTDAAGQTAYGSTVVLSNPSGNIAVNIAVNQTGGCSGTATLTASASGGQPAYSYAWSVPGATGNTITVPTPGTYTVTVTDLNGCTGTKSVAVSGGFTANLTTNSAGNLCAGDAHGTATVNITGGTAPFTYTWNPAGPNQPTRNNLAAGTYTVTVSDASGCPPVVLTGVITAPSPVVVLVQPFSDPCDGNAENVTVSASGGTGPYTYAWSNGQTGATAHNLGIGTYTVTATDANSCTGTVSVTVKAITSTLQGTISVVSQVRCLGDANGSLVVTPSGGVAPYHFVWSTGATTDTLKNLAAGTYTVSITDATDCPAVVLSGTLNAPAPIVVAALSFAIPCDGILDTLTASASGGSAPYTYAWSTGGSGASIFNVPVGTVSVTATDANGCTGSANIVVPGVTIPLQAMVQTTNNLCAEDSLGTATVVVTGGIPPYQFHWNYNNGTGNNLSGLPAGTFTVSVTDGSDCPAVVASGTVTAPPPLTGGAVPFDIPCDGILDTLIASVSGGVAPYTFVWSNGASGQLLTNVPAGTISFTVTDANGCTNTMSVVIPTITTPLQVEVTTTANPCSGDSLGTATAVATGGIGSYQFHWSNGATTPTIFNLPAGIYCVSVTDGSNCPAVSACDTVAQPASLTVGVEPFLAPCDGTLDTLTATVSGGVGPYSFAWSTGASGQTIVNVPVSTIGLTVTDANGCTASTTVTIPPVNSTLQVIIETTNGDCGSGGGTAIAVASGGVPPYQFLWSNGATNDTITNLASGIYCVSVTDATDCPAVSACDTINNSSTLIVTILPFLAPPCTGAVDSISAVASGGTPPYTYQWSTGATGPTIYSVPVGTYTVTATDANGCTGTTTVTVNCCGSPLQVTLVTPLGDSLCLGDSTAMIVALVSGGVPPYQFLWNYQNSTNDTLFNVPAGTYTVTVTDASTCGTAVASITIGTYDSPVASIDPFLAPCDGILDSATVSVSGGTPPYTYQWSNGQTQATIHDLAAGTTTTVTVTDANGCSDTTSVTVPFVTPLSVVIISTNNLCPADSNGTAIVIVSGGVPPYTFLWDYQNSTNDTLTNLPAGTYCVTVMDASDCPAATACTTISGPADISIEVMTMSSACNGSTGSATVQASGGTPAYTYQWNDPANTNGPTVMNLAPGTYTVTVTDAAGCQTTEEVEIPPVAALEVNLAIDPAACTGVSNGSATVTVTGGGTDLTYVWNTPNGNGALATGLAAGDTVSVTVTDNISLCTGTASAPVGADAEIEVQAQATDVPCLNSLTGSVVLTILPAGANYGVSWTLPGNVVVKDVLSLNGLGAGTYTYLVKDSLTGCEASGSVNIVTLGGVDVQVADDFIETCDSLVTLNATATGAASFTWKKLPDGPTFTGSSIEVVAAGINQYEVTAVLGLCSDTDTVTVEGHYVNVVVTTPDVNTCDPTATLNAVVYGEAGSLNWTDQNNQSLDQDSTVTVTVTPTTSIYTITATNAKCSDSATATVTGNSLGLEVEDNFIQTCDSLTTLTASVTGTATFTWKKLPNGPTFSGPSIEVVAAGTAQYEVTAVNGLCTDTDTVTVEGHYLNVAVAIPNIITCDQTADLTAVATGDVDSVKWIGPGGQVYFGATVTVPAIADSTLTYTVVASNGDCSDTATATVKGETLNINIADHFIETCDSLVTLTASVTGTATFTWKKLPNGPTFTGPSIEVVAAGTNQYEVTAIKDLCTDVDTVSVEGHYLNVTVLTPNQSTCDQTTTLSALATGDVDSVKWIGPGGQVFFGATVTVPAIADSTLTYTVVASNGDCSDTATATVKGETLNMNIADHFIKTCDSLVTLTASVTGTATFTWKKLPDGPTFTGPSIEVVAAGAAQYEVTAVDGLCTDIDTVAVEGHYLNVTVLTPNQSTCDQTTTLSALATGDVDSVKWSGPGGVFFGATVTVPVVAGATVTYTVEVSNGDCSDTGTATVKGETLDMSVADDFIQTCDSLATLSASVTGGGTISWKKLPDGPSFPGSTIVVVAAGINQYEVTAVSGLCSKVDTVTVEGHYVNVVVTSPSVSTCDPSTTLTAVVYGEWNNLNWTDPNNQSVGAADSVVVTVLPGTNLYTITASNADCSDSATANVQGNSINLNVADDFVETCDLVATLTANASSTGTVFFWKNLQTGQPAGNTASIQVPATTSETYYEVSASLPGTACVETDTVKVLSHHLTIDAEAIGGNTGCEGIAKPLKVTGGNPGDVLTYQWSAPAGLVLTPTNADSISAIGALGTYAVTVTVTNQFACTAQAVVNLTIGPSNSLDGKVEADLCKGLLVGFTNKSNYPGTWNFGDNSPTSTVDDPTHPYASAGTYTVTFTPNAPCVEPFDTVIQVQSTPILVLAAVPDTVVCDEAPITISASATTGAVLTWSQSPDFSNPLSHDPALTVSPVFQGVYYVQAIKDGCKAVDTVLVNNAKLVLNTSPGEQTICSGNSTELTAFANNETYVLTYLWNPTQDTIPSLTVTPPAGTAVYSVLVSNQYGCSDTASFLINVIQVAVTAAVDKDTICVGQTAQLTATVTGNGQTYTYQWTPSETLTGADTPNPIAMPLETTTYTVTVLADNLCPAMSPASITLNVMGTDCKEPYIFVPKAFSPNGDDKNDRLRVRGVNLTELYFVVYDRWGEKVYETNDVNHLGWDGSYHGTNSTPDSYGWYLHARCANGQVYENKGNSTLLK